MQIADTRACTALSHDEKCILSFCDSGGVAWGQCGARGAYDGANDRVPQRNAAAHSPASAILAWAYGADHAQNILRVRPHQVSLESAGAPRTRT